MPPPRRPPRPPLQPPPPHLSRCPPMIPSPQFRNSVIPTGVADFFLRSRRANVGHAVEGPWQHLTTTATIGPTSTPPRTLRTSVVKFFFSKYKKAPLPFPGNEAPIPSRSFSALTDARRGRLSDALREPRQSLPASIHRNNTSETASPTLRCPPESLSSARRSSCGLRLRSFLPHGGCWSWSGPCAGG